jgi:hypothetical protein
MLPTSYTLSSDLLSVDPNPFARENYGDVYKGTLDGSKVCVKRVRVYVEDDLQTVKKVRYCRRPSPLHQERNSQAFCEETIMWKHLVHPNVLPLLGVTIDGFQLISNWMSGGHLLAYIQNNTEADRLGLVCIPLVVVIPRSLPSPAVRRSQGPPLPPLPQCHSRGPQGCAWALQILFRHRTNARPAKHPCGRLWSCPSRRFWLRYGHSEPGFRPEYPVPSWLHCAMGCARNL